MQDADIHIIEHITHITSSTPLYCDGAPYTGGDCKGTLSDQQRKLAITSSMPSLLWWCAIHRRRLQGHPELEGVYATSGSLDTNSVHTLTHEANTTRCKLCCDFVIVNYRIRRFEYDNSHDSSFAGIYPTIPLPCSLLTLPYLIVSFRILHNHASSFQSPTMMKFPISSSPSTCLTHFLFD